MGLTVPTRGPLSNEGSPSSRFARLSRSGYLNGLVWPGRCGHADISRLTNEAAGSATFKFKELITNQSKDIITERCFGGIGYFST